MIVDGRGVLEEVGMPAACARGRHLSLVLSGEDECHRDGPLCHVGGDREVALFEVAKDAAFKGFVILPGLVDHNFGHTSLGVNLDVTENLPLDGWQLGEGCSVTPVDRGQLLFLKSAVRRL